MGTCSPSPELPRWVSDFLYGSLLGTYVRLTKERRILREGLHRGGRCGSATPIYIQIRFTFTLSFVMSLRLGATTGRSRATSY
jgi:hypothetical protein